MTNLFTFVFPPDVEQERGALQQTLREAVSKGDLQIVKAAQEELCMWLQTYPNDYVMWDAGEPLALLADTLEAETAQSEPAYAT